MSGLQIESTRKTIEILGNLYDAELIGEFITNEEICGDPINNIVFNVEHIESLWNVFKDNNDILDTRINHMISSFCHKDQLPQNAKSKSIKYFENQISTCILKLLAFCELGNEEEFQQESIASHLWTHLLHSFCCLLRLNPLNAVKSGTKLIGSFTDALKYFRDNFNVVGDTNEQKINYNSTTLLAICGSIKKLVEQINVGVLSGNIKDTILQINKNLKIQIHYF
jgi:hypothetical protein